MSIKYSGTYGQHVSFYVFKQKDLFLCSCCLSCILTGANALALTTTFGLTSKYYGRHLCIKARFVVCGVPLRVVPVN